MKLEDIRKLCDEATEGPWDFVPTKSAGCSVGPSMKGPETLEDAVFIAAARTLMPKLLAVAEAAKRAPICEAWDESYCTHREFIELREAQNQLQVALESLEAEP